MSTVPPLGQPALDAVSALAAIATDATAHAAKLAELNTYAAAELATLRQQITDLQNRPPTAGDPLAPYVGRFRLGSSHNLGRAGFENLERTLGVRMHAQRIFNTAGASVTAVLNSIAPALTANQIPVVSIKSGYLDLPTLARETAARATGPVIFVLDHEPENPVKNGTAAGFRAGWHRFADAFRTDAPDVLLAPTFMDHTARGAKGYPLSDWLPERWAWDALGIDLYRIAAGPLAAAAALTPSLEWARRYGKLHLIAEMGISGTSVARTAYLSAMFKTRPADSILWCWFNSHVGDPPVTYDGTKTWAMDHATDRLDTDLVKLWADTIRALG